jgi:tetratricopeptide (TPR) repeat protein
MKLPVNTKIISIVGILSVIVIIILFRGQKKVIERPDPLPPEHPSAPMLPPSKENVSKSLFDHIDMLKKKVDTHPGDIHSIKSLAQLLMDSHRTDEAISYFEQGLKLQPLSDSLLLDLSVCYFEKKEYAKAMQTTERILKYNKNNIRGLLNKGVIFAVQKKNEEAAKNFHKVIELSPKSAEAKQAQNYLIELGMK